MINKQHLTTNYILLFIFAFFVFSLIPAISFALCWTNTGSLAPSRADGSCYPGTSPNKPSWLNPEPSPNEINQFNPTPSPFQPQPIYDPNLPLLSPGTSGGTSGSGVAAPNGTFGSGKTSNGSGGSQSITIPNPLGQTKTFGQLINRIVNWLLIIASPILVLMIIIGAFQIMTGAGEPEKITKGRHTITYAIIGYALLLISSGVTSIIADLLSR